MRKEHIMEYKVGFYMDGEYEVYTIRDEGIETFADQHYKGSLSDCEAWIRLTESGRM